jgi:hypothetical protein
MSAPPSSALRIAHEAVPWPSQKLMHSLANAPVGPYSATPAPATSNHVPDVTAHRVTAHNAHT